LENGPGRAFSICSFESVQQQKKITISVSQGRRKKGVQESKEEEKGKRMREVKKKCKKCFSCSKRSVYFKLTITSYRERGKKEKNERL